MFEVYLGSTPSEEECAQVGDKDYEEKSRRECRAYLNQLIRVAKAAGKDVPESVRLRVKACSHDLGTYHDVVAKCPDGDEEACNFCVWLENNTPVQWDEEACRELGIVSPASIAECLASALMCGLKKQVTLGDVAWEKLEGLDKLDLSDSKCLAKVVEHVAVKAALEHCLQVLAQAKKAREG